MRIVAGLVAIVSAIVFVSLVARSKGNVLPTGPTVFGDFRAHWVAGRMLLDGQLAQLYDPNAQFAVQSANVRPDAPPDAFLSPPFMALVWAPFAAMPYFTAGILWTLVASAIVIASARLAWSALDLKCAWTDVAIVAIASEPFWKNTAMGQDGALALLVYAGALVLWRKKKSLACGMVLGLGCFKPQLFFLVPVALIAAREWRALLGMAVAGSALGAISIALVGPTGLRAWLSLIASPLVSSAIHEENLSLMASVPAFLRALTGSRMFAPIVAISVAILLALFVRRDPKRAIGAAAIASIVAAPHAFVYDAVIALVPCAELLEKDAKRGARAALVFLAITWALPAGSNWFLALPWTAVALAAVCVSMAASDEDDQAR